MVMGYNTEDLVDAGMGDFLIDQPIDPDSPMLIAEREQAAMGMPSRDKVGRVIISWNQFQEQSRTGANLADYAIRLVRPGKRGVYTGQASKLQKFWGKGYRPLGYNEQAKSVAAKTATRPTVAESAPAPDAPKIFFCSDKYPDCTRFFDNPKGLKFHWNQPAEKGGHGEAPIRKAAAPVEPPPEE